MSTKQSIDKVLIIRGIAAIVAGIILVWFFYLKTPDFNTIGNDYKGSWFCTIAEDGSYMIIDTDPLDFGEYIEEGSEDAIQNINKKAGFPESVYAQMISTRAIDGTQEYENDGYYVSWTYHPDDGLEVLYSMK